MENLLVSEIIAPVGNGCTEPLDCIMANGKRAIVKTYNNEQSNIVLVNEIVSYHIAQLLDLPMPSSGICVIDDSTKTNGFITSDKIGKGFYSERIDRATVLSIPAIINLLPDKSVISKIILFDHFVYNRDRNKGNLLVSSSKESVAMHMIDHTHVFKLGSLWSKIELQRGISDDDYLDTDILEWNRYVYNIFFQGVSVKKEQLLLCSADFKSKINEDALRTIIEKVPAEWDVSSDDLDALVEYLMYRVDHLDEICEVIYANKSVEGVSSW